MSLLDILGSLPAEASPANSAKHANRQAVAGGSLAGLAELAAAPESGDGGALARLAQLAVAAERGEDSSPAAEAAASCAVATALDTPAGPPPVGNLIDVGVHEEDRWVAAEAAASASAASANSANCRAAAGDSLATFAGVSVPPFAESGFVFVDDAADLAEEIAERAALMAEGCGMSQPEALQEATWAVQRRRSRERLHRHAEIILRRPAGWETHLLWHYESAAEKYFGPAVAAHMTMTMRNFVQTQRKKRL